MLTTNKEITTKEYWAKVYSGQNDNAKVDASNTVRPKNAFDRFSWVAEQVSENDNRIIEIGAGHARICERIRSIKPKALIIASDQCEAAMNVSKFMPYIICNAYEVPYENKYFDLLIAAQCLEYMDDLDRFFTEAKRVAKRFLCTIPKGQMGKWSQLYIFDEVNFKEIISKYGRITIERSNSDLLLYKVEFYENN